MEFDKYFIVESQSGVTHENSSSRMVDCSDGLAVTSQVRPTSFENPAYTVSIRESIDVTTPDRRPACSDFYERAMVLRRLRREQNGNTESK